MEQSKLLITAMAEQCRSMIQASYEAEDSLPQVVRPGHLVWMCRQVEQHAADWPAIKLHRWIGFVQCGMVANRILDFAGAKSMFDQAKNAYGEVADDPDLVDHLDPNCSFDMDIGGQG